jgi:hypothetical protein
MFLWVLFREYHSEGMSMTLPVLFKNSMYSWVLEGGSLKGLSATQVF